MRREQVFHGWGEPGAGPALGESGAALLRDRLGVSGEVVSTSVAADAVRLASSAFGTSGKLRAVVTDPNRPLELPLEWADVNTSPVDVAYRWEPFAGTSMRSLLGEGQLMHGLRAPAQAGIWRLRLRATRPRCSPTGGWWPTC